LEKTAGPRGEFARNVRVTEEVDTRHILSAGGSRRVGEPNRESMARERHERTLIPKT